MYLELIPNNPYPQFDVFDEDKLVVRIKIDKAMQALRITCNDTRRVLFMAEEKSKKAHVFNLLNEYSQPLGMLTKDNLQNNFGGVEIEDLNINYLIIPKPVKEIVLFDNNWDFILSCRINDALSAEHVDHYINYFILALSWFTFLSKEKK